MAGGPLSDDRPMKLELIRIETDTTPLDGVWYLPEGKRVRGVVQLFHGNTMNFYVGPPRFLPPRLVELGFACLAYNRRGHDVLSNRDSRDLEGGAYQTIAQAVEDNVSAHRWIAERGFGPPILVGHSNGGTLAVRHAADNPDVPAMVLLSAHRGGRDLMRTMAENGLMAGDRFEELSTEARDLVATGQGNKLLLVPGWWYVISAATFVEFLDNAPDIVELAPRVHCPTLYLRGDREPPELYPVEAFVAGAAAEVTSDILPDCDHYYRANEDVVADRVADWIDTLI